MKAMAGRAGSVALVVGLALSMSACGQATTTSETRGAPAAVGNAPSAPVSSNPVQPTPTQTGPAPEWPATPVTAAKTDASWFVDAPRGDEPLRYYPRLEYTMEPWNAYLVMKGQELDLHKDKNCIGINAYPLDGGRMLLRCFDPNIGKEAMDAWVVAEDGTRAELPSHVVSAAPDGSAFASLAEGGTLVTIHDPQGAVRHTVTVPKSSDVVWSSTGLWAGLDDGTGDNGVWIDPATGGVSAVEPGPAARKQTLAGVEWDQTIDGKQVCLAADGTTVFCATARAEGEPFTLEPSPTGTHVAVSLESGMVAVITPALRRVFTVPPGGSLVGWEDENSLILLTMGQSGDDNPYSEHVVRLDVAKQSVEQVDMHDRRFYSGGL